MFAHSFRESASPPRAGVGRQQDRLRPGRTRWGRVLIALGTLQRRCAGILFVLAGPRYAYLLTAAPARWLYRLLTPLRVRSEGQCRAALRGRVRPEDVPALAERAFVHRVWDLVDLPMAERYLHRGTYARFGGQIPAPQLAELQAAQRRQQPAILVSAYYGPFDLLPVFLGFQDVRATVVYRRHTNTAFDAYRMRVRAKSGCALVPVEEAFDALPRTLEAGGTIAIVADHHAGRRGLETTFLGLPTRTMKTAGLLAWRYAADVVVAGIRRRGAAFAFEIIVADVIKAADWGDKPEPVRYITARYLRGLERIVLADPSQYLWAQSRWGDDFAREVVRGTPAGS